MSSSLPASVLANLLADYAGPMKVRRLLYIAERTTSNNAVGIYDTIIQLFLSSLTSPQPAFLLECLSAARSQLGEQLDPLLLSHDTQAWLITAEKAVNNRLSSCEARFNNAKRDGDRETLYQAFLNHSNTLYETGDYATALQKYIETKEYAGNSSESIILAMGILKCSILLGTFAHVRTQAQRIQVLAFENAAINSSTSSSSSSSSSTSTIQSQIDAAQGLYYLHTKNYRLAAQSFLTVTPALNQADPITGLFNDIITLRDCLVYGTLCALATYSRDELKSQLMSKREWRKNVDIIPVWKTITSAFIDSDFSLSFTQINQLQYELSLDRNISTHIHRLMKEMKSKGIVQAFTPYSSLSLLTLSNSFHLDSSTLEKLLIELILAARINGKINTQTQTLVAVTPNIRKITYEKVDKLHEYLVEECQLLLLRMNLVENDVRIKGSNK